MSGFTGWRLYATLLSVAALLGAILYIDHRGFQRAEDLHKLEQLKADARQMDLAITFGDVLRKAINKIDEKLATRIGDIDAAETTIIKPTLEREIVRESRLSDPAVGITDGLRGAINAARAQTACTSSADGSTTCPLPAAAPARR